MEDNRIDNVYMSFFSNNFGLPLDVLDSSIVRAFLDSAYHRNIH